LCSLANTNLVHSCLLVSIYLSDVIEVNMRAAKV